MKSKKGLIIGGAIAGLVAIAAIATVLILFVFKGNSDTYRVIKVMKADGHCNIIRGDITDLEAYEGMALQSGDIIHVDGNSSLVLMLDDDKFAYIEQNTDFELVAQGTAKDSRTRIDLKCGAITCEVRNSLSTESMYEVNTPNSTMAVRGTSFRIEVTDMETIKKVMESSAIQPSMLFLGEKLENASDSDKYNTITRLTVTDGKVKVALHDENGNQVGDEVEFEVNTDVIIGGNETDSSLIEEITGIDPSTFAAVTIEFFIDISEGSGKMIITISDLKDQLEDEQGAHMVIFMYDNKVFATQMVDYEKCATKPLLSPTAEGHWDADFSLPVTTDTFFIWKED